MVFILYLENNYLEPAIKEKSLVVQVNAKRQNVNIQEIGPVLPRTILIDYLFIYSVLSN